MPVVLTLPERLLVAELTIGVARRLHAILGPKANGAYKESDVVFHGFASDFEDCCDVLWRLGVARASDGELTNLTFQAFKNLDPAGRKTKMGPTLFSFLEPEDIRNALFSELLETSPKIDELLSSYLRIACGYDLDGSILSTKREPFVPQNEFKSEIDALERSGYVERLGPAMIWTDKIAPAMQAAYFWNADVQSLAAVNEVNHTAECLAALDLTPEHTKRLLEIEAKRLSELDFAKLLRDRFDGLFWSKNPDGSARPSPSNATLVKSVYRTLRSRQ